MVVVTSEHLVESGEEEPRPAEEDADDRVERRVVRLPVEARVEEHNQQTDTAEGGRDHLVRAVGSGDAMCALDVLDAEEEEGIDPGRRDDRAVCQFGDAHHERRREVDAARPPRAHCNEGESRGHDKVEELQQHRPVMEVEEEEVVHGDPVHLEGEDERHAQEEEQPESCEDCRSDPDGAKNEASAAIHRAPVLAVRGERLGVGAPLGGEHGAQLRRPAPEALRGGRRRHIRPKKEEVSVE